MINKHMTQKKFDLIIENLRADLEFDYLEAIVYYCDHHDTDHHSVMRLIGPNLKRRIHAEVEKNNLLKSAIRTPPIFN